jgi:small subunit ribosomal protein S9
MKEYFFGTGRRKTSIAQVRIFKGEGKIKYTDEKKEIDDILTEEVRKPLKAISKEKNFDITLKISGGGRISQAHAAKLGVSRALLKAEPESEKTLKKAGFLTRDSREKERKKPGLRRARRAPQWAKR